MIADFERVEPRIDRVLTQYRESPKLLNLMRTYMRQVEQVEQSLDTLPSFFDLDSATGDQLTIIGKRLGFPRMHCVCQSQPVFGFPCDDDATESIFGFCVNAEWEKCSNQGVTDISIDDDEMYRNFLRVRRYQILNLYDRQSLTETLRILWGPTAKIMDQRHGRVIITPGRPLEPQERAFIQLYPRVLPVGMGIAIRFHFGSIRAFGFGEGWGGFCDGEVTDGLPILTADDEEILTVNDEPLLTGELGIGSDWLCQIDVRPYDC